MLLHGTILFEARELAPALAERQKMRVRPLRGDRLLGNPVAPLGFKAMDIPA